jgi:hypothetical protein
MLKSAKLLHARDVNGKEVKKRWDIWRQKKSPKEE